MRRVGVGIAALFALAFVVLQPGMPSAAEVQELAPEIMIQWDGETEHFTYGEMTLDITTSSETEGITTVTLTVAGPRVEPVSVTAEAGGGPYVTLGVYPLDDSGADTILFTVYTGGAHCCMQTYAITATSGGFVVADVGMIDGDNIQPTDLDGDGQPELVLYDDRFNYMFSAYAFSRPTQQIFRFADGKMYDASRDERYAGYYQARLEDLAEGCGGDSGWLIPDCAGYLGTAAILGTFDAEFPKVEAAWKAGKFDAESGWTEFSLCADAGCKATNDFTDFPEAVTAALTQWGYLDGEAATPTGSKDKG